MLRHILFAFSLVAILCFTISCNNDDDGGTVPEPVEPELIVVINNDGFTRQVTADLQDTLTIEATALAEAGISSFVVQYTVDDETTVILSIRSDTATQYVMNPYELFLGFPFSGKEVFFEITLIDKLFRTVETSFTLRVNESPITSISGAQLGVFGHELIGNAYNVLQDTAYFPFNLRSNLLNQDAVDFLVHFDAVDKWQLFSPEDDSIRIVWNDQVTFDWPFLATNATKLVVLDTLLVDFDKIISGVQISSAYRGEELSQVSGLYRNQLIAFTLGSKRGRRMGIIKINSFSGRIPANRTINFDLKIQE